MQIDKKYIKKSTKANALFKNNHFAIGGVMSLGIRISAIDSEKYGALEIKNGIKKNTFISFGNVMLILAMSLIIAFSYTTVKVIEVIKEDIKSDVRIPITDIIEAHKKEVIIQENQNREFAKIENLATKEVAGTIVAIDDPVIAKDLKNYSTFDNLDKSLASQTGKIIEDPNEILQKVEKSDPAKSFVMPIALEAENEVSEVEIEPNVDLDQIMKLVEYPAMARKLELEGLVIVKLLIDKTGKPTKYEVLRSNSEILTNAAIEALFKATYTPAIQNGIPVNCWIAIPIKFQLK